MRTVGNQKMKPFAQFPEADKKKIRFVLTDIDDTLTFNGRLPSVAFSAMEHLQRSNRKVVPITGRPAGWCDHIARMWPVDGVVGENGAFYFYYNEKQRKMRRRYFKSEAERRMDHEKLAKLKQKILATVPGCGIAADQAYREADLAIDFCEDVEPLPLSAVEDIVRCFQRAGAQAKISSIHVNGWFGKYDKLAMVKLLFAEVFGENLDSANHAVIFVGDSPNDAPLFGYFRHSIGVANILRFKDHLSHAPAWITRSEGGYGFSEMADQLLSAG
jgi:HAD superfamily hydrolase (TIGR01484 family)